MRARLYHKTPGGKHELGFPAPPPPVVETREVSIEDSVEGLGDFEWTFSPGWNVSTGSALSGGSDHWTQQSGTSATFRFVGTRAVIYGAKQDHHGMTPVTVDGVAAGTADYYRVGRLDNTPIFDTGDLPNGRHTVVLSFNGERNPAYTGSFPAAVTIDRALVQADASVAPVPDMPVPDGFRSLSTVVYDLWGAPLRTDGQFPAHGKHELELPTNTSYNWTHGAIGGDQTGFPVSFSGQTWTHHNVWGQLAPARLGTPERRVRCHVIVDGVWHLVNGVWVQRKTASQIGELEGAYWSTVPSFSPVLNMVKGTHFRAEPEGGYSFDLLPTTNSDGTPNNQAVGHWYYKGFWPRVEMVPGTQAVAIQSRMRLISDDPSVDPDTAMFAAAFSGDLYVGSEVSVNPGGINPAFAIPRHKRVRAEWQSFGIVTGVESSIKGYPAMPFVDYAAPLISDDGSGSGVARYSTSNTDPVWFLENNTSEITRTGGVVKQTRADTSQTPAAFRMWTKKAVGGPGKKVRLKFRIKATSINNVEGGIVEGVKVMIKWVAPNHSGSLTDPANARGIYPWPHPTTGANMSPGSITYVPLSGNGYHEISRRNWGSNQYVFPVNRKDSPRSLNVFHDLEVTLEWLSNPKAVRVTGYFNGNLDFQWTDAGNTYAGGSVYDWACFPGLRTDAAVFELDSFSAEEYV